MTPTACTGRRFSKRRSVPIDYRTLDDLGNTDDIEIALAWKPDRGLLASFKNIKLIVSLGMGVDHLLADDKLPDVPIVRIMDDGLVGQMSEYAIFWALRHHRDIDKYAASQRAKQWKPLDFVDTIHRRVGVMGLGTIGQDTARKFAALGFPDGGLEPHGQGAARHRDLPRQGRLREVPGAHRHPGRRPAAHARHAAASSMRRRSPGCPRAPTSSTWRAAAMSSTRRCWRRSTRGHLAGAALDVFNTEPLPADHRYWTHPKVQVTPHIAGATNPRTASPGIIENIKRLRSGQALINTVDPKTGYSSF